MFVMIATRGRRLWKLRSNSHASATNSVARARAAAAAELRDGAADDEARVGPALEQGVGDHRGGRALAVRAGDGDAEPLLHHLPEQLGVLDRAGCRTPWRR